MRARPIVDDVKISMAATAEHELELECCCMLLPRCSSLSAFSGFITSKSGIDYYIELHLPGHFQDLEDQADRTRVARLDVDWRLDYILRPHRATLVKSAVQLLKESESVSGFVRNLMRLVEQLDCGGCMCAPLPPVDYYSKITDHLAKVGWSNVLETSSDLTTLKLVAYDDHGRGHILSIHISPAQYPEQLPRLSVDAPAVFQPTWSPSGALVNLLSQFKAWLDQFHFFWSTMELIDSSLWVLEPLQPTRAANSRRIVLDNSSSLSMYLEVDWHRPSSPPQCSFLGPDKDVARLKKAFARQRQTWDDSGSLLDNLKRILCVEFPSQPKTTTELESIECSICYQGNEEGETPDICCDNCSKYYHKGCIVEWFKGLPTAIHTTFQSLSGECPYCNKRIAVKP